MSIAFNHSCYVWKQCGKGHEFEKRKSDDQHGDWPWVEAGMTATSTDKVLIRLDSRGHALAAEETDPPSGPNRRVSREDGLPAGVVVTAVARSGCALRPR